MITYLLRKIELIDRFLDIRTQKQNNACLTDINTRIRKKADSGEKINVVFVCHRPSVWGALKTVYEHIKEDAFFNATIVAIPKVNVNAPDGIDDEGAEDYFRSYGAVNGYDPQTKSFIDLKQFNPDYVFFQQPYNVNMPKEYNSSKVCKYAKLCYIPYFSFQPNLRDMSTENSCWQKDYINDVSLYFSENASENRHVKGLLKKFHNTFTKVYLTGYPKDDDLLAMKDQTSNVWNFEKHDRFFRILWTPRWTTNEGACHFFDYKDLFLEYAENNKDVDFVFRPHPQTWYEFETTGEFPAEKAAEYRSRYDMISNACIDETIDYIPTFWTSDVLVSDQSSMIMQYLMTGKPVIFCFKEESINGFNRTGEISDVLYWAENWTELKAILDGLRRQEDPLKEKRMAFIKSLLPDDETPAGKKVKEIIKKDALGLL